jgi:hypothetical protein
MFLHSFFSFSKAVFVNFVAICAKKVSETKGSICKALNSLRKDATKTDKIQTYPIYEKEQLLRKQLLAIMLFMLTVLMRYGNYHT